MKKIRMLVMLFLIVASIPVLGSEPQVLVRNMPAPFSSAEMINGFVITSPQGIKCFLNTANITDDLKSELSNPINLMVFSDKRFDNFTSKIYSDFQGAKTLGEEKVVKSGDVTVATIKSSDTGDEPDGSTYIILVDVAGFRIAHFGSCAQAVLTKEQLAQIGRVDLAISQFEDSYCGVNATNKICYKLMDQVNPTIIIPTHIFSTSAVKLLHQKWPAENAASDTIMLSKALLDKGRRSVFMNTMRNIAEKAGVKPSKER